MRTEPSATDDAPPASSGTIENLFVLAIIGIIAVASVAGSLLILDGHLIVGVLLIPASCVAAITLMIRADQRLQRRAHSPNARPR